MTATSNSTSTSTNTNNPFRKIHALLLHSKAWTLVIVATAAILYTEIFTASPVTDLVGLAGFAVIVVASYTTTTKRVSA